ncbi:MAG: tRNA (adenosine(37)-N6)-threonylcarbamoyltransferase complex dimerization subunit type 1 TsaB [Elusimicrobiota bacterium]
MEDGTATDMKILAIETSGAAFSVAAAENGRLVKEIFWHAGLKHSEKLIPAVNRLLKAVKWRIKDIKKIAVSTGPGSFTGIRVGLSCARAIAQDLEIPLVGIDTLKILEAGAQRGGVRIFPAIDALRSEVFAKNPGTGVPEIAGINDFISGLKREKTDVCVVGSAALTYFSEFSKRLGNKVIFGSEEMNCPRAGVLSLMAGKLKGAKYDKAKPLYIRRSWAEEKRR